VLRNTVRLQQDEPSVGWLLGDFVWPEARSALPLLMCCVALGTALPVSIRRLDLLAPAPIHEREWITPMRRAISEPAIQAAGRARGRAGDARTRETGV
jgi:hypothetical protein